MATLYITEYTGVGVMNAQVSQTAAEPAITTQTVSTSGTSAASSAFNANTRIVRIIGTGNMHIIFDADSAPTATTGDQKLIADTAEWRAVTPGGYLAAIDGA